MSGIKNIVKERICPNGHHVSCDMRFCPICGAEIGENCMRFCPNCGKERQQGDLFCTNCGFSFEQKGKEDKDDDFSFFGFLWID